MRRQTAAWACVGLLAGALAGAGAAGAGPAAARGLVLIAGGDVLLDRGVGRAIAAAGDPAYPFAGLAPLLRGADVALANLECALTDSGTLIQKDFMFHAPGALADELRGAGFTVLDLANNHACDAGREGLAETARHLERAGIRPLGFGANQDGARRPVAIAAGGARVALLACVDMPLEGLMPLPGLPGPALADDEAMAAAVRSASGEANRTIVTVHWGQEYSPTPTARQRALARRLIEAGADLVVGHHPHVIQSVERIGSGIVFYSVGNLVFDQTRPDCVRGLLVRLEVAPDEPRRAPPRVSLLPLRLDGCRPRPAEPALARQIVAQVAAHSDSVTIDAGHDGWWTVH